MSNVRLSLLQPENAAEYEAYLATHPASLLYYGLKYRRFLEDLLDCESSYWIAHEDDQITGILPAMTKPGPAGRVINSLPYYGSNGGVLASSHSSEVALVQKFEELASASDVVSATWISHPYINSAIIPSHDLQDERISQITPLVDDRQILLERIDGSARRNIKKAQSEGITVRVQNDAFEFLEKAHRAGMASIAGNAKSGDFFRKVPLYFEADRDYRIYVAEREGNLCAALLLFYFNRTVEYYTPATLESERAAQPMALILLNAMLDGAAQGFARWNWGGTWLSQDGVGRFKQKWGATSNPYRYYTKINRPDIKKYAPKELIRSYPGFYVIPFSALETA